MKVSIIIPAYNEEKFIGKTLECALAQNYPDFEIIVVDNNSIDKTNEIAKSFGVKVFFEKNKGTGPAREKGRREATGEILAFLDADCLPEKDWIRKGVKWFEHDKNIVGLTGPYDYFDSPGFYRFFSSLLQKNIYSFFNIFLQKINKGAVLIFGNCFIRASSMESAGGIDSNIIFYGDDTDTAKRLAKKGRVIFDKNLIMKGSARRLKKEGMIKIPLLYFFHFFKVSLFGKTH
ncbi:MAG: glycosyltransferase family A protein [bacterium]